MYFHTDHPSTLFVLSQRLQDAEENGRRVRLRTDERGWLYIKTGEGMWDILKGTPDPYMD